MDTRALKDFDKGVLNFFIGNKLRILNRRKIGDIFGRLTYLGPRNKSGSLIDYGLAHEDTYGDVDSFKVHHFTDLSDHSMISLNIKAGSFFKKKVNSTCHLSEFTSKYIWEEDRASIFVNCLKATECTKDIHNVISMLHQ